MWFCGVSGRRKDRGVCGSSVLVVGGRSGQRSVWFLCVSGRKDRGVCGSSVLVVGGRTEECVVPRC